MVHASRGKLPAAFICLSAILAGCTGSGDDPAANAASGPETSDVGTATSDVEAALIDTTDCPTDATDPIEGPVRLGTTMPLSGGPAAAAFAPIAAGLEAYIDFANEEGLLPGHEIELTVADDQFNPNLTTPAVEQMIDATGVHAFIGMIGTANNLAVRELLNEECFPQMFVISGSPEWGRVEDHPWTTMFLAPYNTETAVYVQDMATEFPDGSSAAIFYNNSEFGTQYQAAFAELAPEALIDIVEEQTIEVPDTAPPTSQVRAIAAREPDIVLAVPVGAQCPAFLRELANARAANPEWNPRVYITNTCGSSLLLGLAGEAAEGIFTTLFAKDSADPALEDDPDVAAYRSSMLERGFPADGDFLYAGVGWTVGELAVESLRMAMESDAGLTRAAIMDAAHSLDYRFQLALEGAKFTTEGAADSYGLESLQVVQYSAATDTYTNVGDVVTDYEGKSQVPEG
jgi:ABC-type branched-subunit amino acid transport system substrate-binding protein